MSVRTVYTHTYEQGCWLFYSLAFVPNDVVSYTLVVVVILFVALLWAVPFSLLTFISFVTGVVKCGAWVPIMLIIFHPELGISWCRSRCGSSIMYTSLKCVRETWLLRAHLVPHQFSGFTVIDDSLFSVWTNGLWRLFFVFHNDDIGIKLEDERKEKKFYVGYSLDDYVKLADVRIWGASMKEKN